QQLVPVSTQDRGASVMGNDGDASRAEWTALEVLDLATERPPVRGRPRAARRPSTATGPPSGSASSGRLRAARFPAAPRTPNHDEAYSGPADQIGLVYRCGRVVPQIILMRSFPVDVLSVVTAQPYRHNIQRVQDMSCRIALMAVGFVTLLSFCRSAFPQDNLV